MVTDRQKPWQKPWQKPLVTAAGAMLIAYAASPWIYAFALATGVSEGTWAEGLAFVLIGQLAIFLPVFLWQMRQPIRPQAFERSVFWAAGLFLAATPGMISLGLLLPDAKRGAVLVVAAMLCAAITLTHGIVLLFWGLRLRKHRAELAMFEALGRG